MKLSLCLAIAFVVCPVIAGPTAQAASAPAAWPGQPSMPSRWVVDPETMNTI